MRRLLCPYCGVAGDGKGRKVINKPNSCLGCPLYTVSHFDKGRLVTNNGVGWVGPEGSPLLGLIFVGEAAGSWEELAGAPFRSNAQAGSILERVFRRIGIDRRQVAIGNVLNCRPPNNLLSGEKYEAAAITHCAPNRNGFLQTSVEYVQSNRTAKQPIIVALGDVAFSTLTGLKGDKLSISRARGYPVMTHHGLVMGTYHPAFVARKKKYFGVLIEDIMKALTWAREGFHEFPRDYLTHPSAQEKDAFVRSVLENSGAVLSWDIETDPTVSLDPHRGIFPPLKSMQFSIAPGKGIFLDNVGSNVEAYRALLASPNVKIGHNIWDFDKHIVEHWGYQVKGILHDSLWMFHHYQPDITVEDMSGDSGQDDDLRLSTSAGLQYTASFCGMDFLWKHHNTDQPEFYGIADVDACSRIWATLPTKMRNLGVWDGYERHVRMIKPILDTAAKRGLWFNLDGRDELHAELTTLIKDLDGVMQAHHPDLLKRVDPPNGFVRIPTAGPKIRELAGIAKGSDALYSTPAIAGGWEWLDDSAVDEAADGREDVDPDLPVVTGVWRKMVKRHFKVTKKTVIKPCPCGVAAIGPARVSKAGKPLKPKEVTVFPANCADCKGVGKYTKVEDAVEERWARLLPFKTSKLQLIAYMNHKRHKVPFDRKAGKQTTAAKKIEELAHSTKDPLYQTVLDIRTVSKMDSTYVTGSWIPTRDWDEYYDGVKRHVGLINTSFTTAPATGQKSSRGPNVQNSPKHIRNANLRPLDLPTKFRRLIVAPPGHQIAEFDYKSAHALTLGFEAGSKDYIRLAKLDVHSFMASMLLATRGVIKEPVNLAVSDTDLRAALKALKASQYVKKDGVWQQPTADIIKAYGVLDQKGKPISYKGIDFLIASEVRDTQAKPAILGYGFGLMGTKLWEMNKDSFRDDIEAQEVLNLIDIAFPPLKKYREVTAQKAHNQKYLVTRFGAVRWFWDVWSFKYDPKNPSQWKTTHGSDYEDAIALGPANDAFGHLDEALLVLDERGLLEEYRFVNTVHDSLIFYLRNDIFDSASDEITKVMEAPSKILVSEVVPEGLSIEVEMKSSHHNWGDLH